MTVQLIPEVTQEYVDWTLNTLKTHNDTFVAAKKIAQKLGGHYDHGLAILGFWAPELLEDGVKQGSIAIEIFTPVSAIDASKKEQDVVFVRKTITPEFAGEFVWAAVSGMTVGTKETVGSFYRGIYLKTDGSQHYFHDVVAYSMPYGLFAPVELYDISQFQQNRADRDYFLQFQETNEIHQFQQPSNILEIHIGTASPEGTIAGLNRIYQKIATKLTRGVKLDPFEQNYIGYDAIQFMPIEPVSEPKHMAPYFDTKDLTIDGKQTVTLRKPTISNWGYDINIHGSSAINSVLLETGRPDELSELLKTLYSFPLGPMMPIWDLVFGHATNQGLEILPRPYFTGPNMYGQDMNFRHPIVRAIMLEMQRRKTNWGATGLRIDGAQDFKYWDETQDQLFHDDDYLQEMSDIVASAAGVHYRPWMIFEDGRPWPRDDWELASTYHSVIDKQPDTWQWGPLTFAHNTPFIFTFWLSKFWRVREIMEFGSHWLSGCSNHDTLRRGAQADPHNRVNSLLGDSRREIIQQAYNNHAQELFFYIMAPGVPMDFLNANMQSPWLYFRNNDDYYGVKVAADEYRFLDWWIDSDIYEDEFKFSRLKAWGFDSYDKLHAFMNDLVDVIRLTDYSLTDMVPLLSDIHFYLTDNLFSKKGLQEFGWDFMDDMYDLVKVSQYYPHQDAKRNDFNLQVRLFRRSNPWLIHNLDPSRGEFFDHLHPSGGRALYYGRRVSPSSLDRPFELLFVANMEGTPITLQVLELPIPDLAQVGWQPLIIPPTLDVVDPKIPLQLKNSEGVVFIRYL